MLTLRHQLRRRRSVRQLSVQVFDRALKGRQREAAASAADFDRYTYLRDEVRQRKSCSLV